MSDYDENHNLVRPLDKASPRSLTLMNPVPLEDFKHKDHYSKLRMVDQLKIETEQALLHEAGDCAHCSNAFKSKVVEEFDTATDRTVFRATISCESRECRFRRRDAPTVKEAMNRESSWRKTQNNEKRLKPVADFDPEEFIQINLDPAAPLTVDGWTGSW